MNLTARVLHNVSADTFFRFDRETSSLFHAHDFRISADNYERAANLIWDLTNVDDANDLQTLRPDYGKYGPQVTHYRARRNRSLSVGDVVLLFEGDVPPADLRYVSTAVVNSVGWLWISPAPAFEDGENTTRFSESYCAHELRHWKADS